MEDLTSAVPSEPTRMTVERYLGLVEAGVARANEALLRAIGGRAHVRPQLSLVLGRRSVPEPDLAVVPGSAADYDAAHPTTAWLVIEVAETSLPQDRLSKAAIYAAAGIPEYWIVNLRDGVVEVMRDPDPAHARWRSVQSVGRDARLELPALPGASVAVADLLPERDASR